jgi:hypothetical protein
MSLIAPKPADIVPNLQRMAVQSLASAYPFERESAAARPANIEKYVQGMLKQLREIEAKAGKPLAYGRPFFQAALNKAEPLQEISSEAWNEAQDRIFVDLYALHRALGESGSEDAYRGELTRDQFIRIQTAILDIVNQVRLYQFLKANPEFQDAKFINFSSSLNETTKTPAAVVDTGVRLLELPPRSRQVQSKRSSVFKGAKISVEHLGGGREGGRNTAFAPEKMLDSSPDSYWAEMIMADAPIRQEYAPSGDGGLGGVFDSNGAICHVTIELAKVLEANTIRLLPFGEFPVRVIDVAFKENAGQTDWVMIPGFQVEDATLDWIEVNFEPRTIAALRVTIEQINYRSNLYHLPEKLVRNGMLWDSILASRKTEELRDLNLTEQERELVKADPQQVAKLLAEKDYEALMGKSPLQQGREQVFQAQISTAMAATKAVTRQEPSDANKISTVLRGTEESDLSRTVTIRTYEYVYGIRDLQVLFNLYQPVAHYASQKLTTNASVIEAGVVTEERHIPANDGLGLYNRTSVEWDLEVGRDRKYPIAPKNWRNGEVITVPDEFLQFDRTTRQAVTRLPMAALQGTLRENGTRVPLTGYTIDEYSPPSSGVMGRYLASGLANPAFFGGADPASNLTGRGIVTVASDRFDPNAVYTLRYEAAEGADVVNVDEDLNSVELPEPEIFKGTSRDNQIVLRAYPYVDYRIINSARWRKVENEAKWTLNPSESNYIAGTVDVTNGSATITGHGTTWLSLTGPLVFRRNGDDVLYKVQTVVSDTQATLATVYEGESGTLVDYAMGQYFETDGKIFALDRSVYEPVKVLVNDIRAVNLTDYEAFEHQAFTDVPRTGRQIQFIHAGKMLYFNRPIENSKIEVFYSWLTQYVQVGATLRCNIPVRTVLTPQINSVRVDLKTSKL